jgi:hypothetical protein
LCPIWTFAPRVPQPLGRTARRDVRAADVVFQVEQHLGDPAHAGAADARRSGCA